MKPILKKILRRENIEIVKVKTIIDRPYSWGGNGIIFYVKNGKGLLRKKYGNYEKESLAVLVYNDIPLVKFHANEYFCPTCESMVSAGYGLNMVQENIIEKMRETLNAPFVSLEQSFDNLQPVFGLLSTGYYALVDAEAYPSNGNGEFFWKTSNIPELNSATCPAYGGDGVYGEEVPKYILPTQPPFRFNRSQAEFYRSKDDYRAIAFYMYGYLCGLLDGHHKAVASALEKRPLKTLVIIPTTSYAPANKNSEHSKAGIYLNGVFLHEDEMITPIEKITELFKYERLSSTKVKEYLSEANNDFQEYHWDKDILEAGEYFPDPLTLARIQWAGDITNERLNRIINNEEALSSEDVLNIATALFKLKNNRFKELTFYFCRLDAWKDVRFDLYTLLSNIKDQEVEDFFIEYLVNYDYYYSEEDVKKVVDDYFAT